MPIQILPATLSDIPTFVDCYMASTRHNPFFTACFPDTPAVRAWFVEMLSAELMTEEGSRFLKAVDSEISQSADGNGEKGKGGDGDGEGEGKIIAFAKWAWTEDKEEKNGQEQDPPLPVWPDGADKDLATEFFGMAARKHKSIMRSKSRGKERENGRKGHWYLEMLFTYPTHQRRGAGSLLMAEVLSIADEHGDSAYLEATPDGNALYRKWGFETVDEVVVSFSVPVTTGDGTGAGAGDKDEDKEMQTQRQIRYSNDLMVRRPRKQ
ncbi:hypothetical protein VTN77DRAFT_36 [Rasamsonia byssochlamydoides]|uniref:uncharacterized protein n=1 Tax=Rasamsonia byssochlamydoides TaxID=89139 RepID=UPI003743ED3A